MRRVLTRFSLQRPCLRGAELNWLPSGYEFNDQTLSLGWLNCPYSSETPKTAPKPWIVEASWMLEHNKHSLSRELVWALDRYNGFGCIPGGWSNRQRQQRTDPIDEIQTPSLKVTVTSISTAMGCPLRSVGWYFHCSTALRAAVTRRGFPETTFICVTLPCSSITESIATFPETLATLARIG